MHGCLHYYANDLQPHKLCYESIMSHRITSMEWKSSESNAVCADDLGMKTCYDLNDRPVML